MYWAHYIIKQDKGNKHALNYVNTFTKYYIFTEAKLKIRIRHQWIPKYFDAGVRTASTVLVFILAYIAYITIWNTFTNTVTG